MSAKCTCGHLLESHAAGGWCNARFGEKRGRYCACETFESNRPAPSPDAPGQRHLAVMAEPLLVVGRVCQKCCRAGDDYTVHIAPGQDEADAGGEVEAQIADILARHRYQGSYAVWCSCEAVEPLSRSLRTAGTNVAALHRAHLAALITSVVAAARADAEGRLGEVLRASRARDQRRYEALAETLHQAVLRAERAEVLAGKLLTIHGDVVMDTPEDRALHHQVIATFRAVLDAAGPREGEHQAADSPRRPNEAG